MKRTCSKILIFGYGSLSLLYLRSFTYYAIDNYGGNRMIVALIALTYFLLITIGLFKYPRAFSLLSAFNFIIGSMFFLSLVISAFSEIHFGLIIYVLLGSLGMYISFLSYKFHDS